MLSNNEEEKIIKDIRIFIEDMIKKYSKKNKNLSNLNNYTILLKFTTITILIIIYTLVLKNKEVAKKRIEIKHFFIPSYTYSMKELQYERKLFHLKEINNKRVFEKRLPLPKEIKCKPHFMTKELMAFLSFLSKNITFFETGSGCSSIIAKYYCKKSYAVEGCKKWYYKGIKNGLKDNLIFKDLKPDDPTWSYPGKKTNLKDWKNYFQSYKKEYNADVILIDGRFKTATAMDIFNKIRDDTIVLIHEYIARPLYFILEEYYQYLYRWDSLVCFIKKKDIKEIPLEIQQRYWNESL